VVTYATYPLTAKKLNVIMAAARVAAQTVAYAAMEMVGVSFDGIILCTLRLTPQHLSLW